MTTLPYSGARLSATQTFLSLFSALPSEAAERPAAGTLGTACGGADSAATVCRPCVGDAIPVAELTRNTLATVSRRSSTSTRHQLAGHCESCVAANKQSARRTQS